MPKEAVAVITIGQKVLSKHCIRLEKISRHHNYTRSQIAYPSHHPNTFALRAFESPAL